jgi:uncharacterized membrane protein YqjE
MTHSSDVRTNVVVFFLILALSALTMVWLFWHYPVKTSIATIAVLAVLGVSARLAQSIEADSASDLDHGEQSI